MTALTSTMQDGYRLTIDGIRRRLAANTGSVISVKHRDADGEPEVLPYRAIYRRLHRLAYALRSLGVREGDRVGSFTWNDREHLELFVGVPSYGAVLHTVNVRLFASQLVYVVNQAQDRVIFVSPDLVPTLAAIAGRMEHLEHVVVCGDADGVDTGDLPGVTTYDALLEAGPDDDFEFPDVAESQAAVLCYTSGTTGNPKGVMYSHRSISLHASSLMNVDSFAVRRGDRVLVVPPMFHVTAWGAPYCAALADADLVLPGRDVSPAAVAGLIEKHRVTFMSGVPTVYSDLLAHLDAGGCDVSSLRECICGGSAPSLSLMQAFEDRHGISIFQAWGMTETSPVCTVSRPPAGVTGKDAWSFRSSQGRAVPWVDMRLVAEDGRVLPHDGRARGELEVRGPWIALAYFETPDASGSSDEGWLRTGDVATISDDGYLRIADRAKDVIKSGGEWISSVELENQLAAHPGVSTAAVIGIPDARWDERPLAYVVVRPGVEVTADELCEHLLTRVAKWWIPERFEFVSEIPRTGVGKINKQALRELG